MFIVLLISVLLFFLFVELELEEYRFQKMLAKERDREIELYTRLIEIMDDCDFKENNALLKVNWKVEGF